MTLPTNKDKELYASRPNDQIFAQIKHRIPGIIEKSEALKERLIQIIIDDVFADHALSNALDEVGKVIEYVAQNEGVEKPTFNGLAVLKDAERVGKLNFILNLCSVLEMDIETTEAVRAAEIERLWGSETKAKKEVGNNVLKLPDELAGILKDITRSLNKKGKGAAEDVAGTKHTRAANGLARTLRERASSNSTTSKRK